jgi:hypothetical protein
MKINLNNFTIDDVRQLIASASDETNVQIRATKDGVAYISTIVGAEDTDDLAFRFETFSAGSDHVGDAAAQDDAWVQRIYDAMKANWPNPTGEYIEFF